MALKYFLDEEFIEGFVKPISWLPTIGKFNKPIWKFQLISIGIVCEDGRTYYAVSNEFNPKDANQWVKDNVLSKLPSRKTYGFKYTEHVEYEGMHTLTGRAAMVDNALVYKSNKQIAAEIFDFFQGNDTRLPHREFINSMVGYHKVEAQENIWIEEPDMTKLNEWRKKHNALQVFTENFNNSEKESDLYAQPEIYGYYSAYDHVGLCILYGTMMQLPKGFPMYTRDTKQMLDDVVTEITNRYLDYSSKNPEVPMSRDFDHMFNLNMESLKKNRDYPKQSNEHNALDDARWTQELYNFIQKYKPGV